MSNQKRGLLIVISGPSASGKGTVNAEVLKNDDFVLSVSATTRAPRPGEIDGVSYHFITEEAFQALVDANGFLEHAGYADNRYGTPRAFVEENLAAGRNVILEIEVAGAMNIRRLYPEAVLIFLMAPSYEEQERRLRSRGTETEEKILARLEKTKKEIAQAEQYDYVVVNETGRVKEAAEDVLAIVRAEHHAMKRNLGIPERYFAE